MESRKGRPEREFSLCCNFFTAQYITFPYLLKSSLCCDGKIIITYANVCKVSPKEPAWVTYKVESFFPAAALELDCLFHILDPLSLV